MNSQLSSGNQRDRVVHCLVEFYNNGNLEAVVTRASSYLEQNPDDYVVWNMLGVAYAQKGEAVEATTAFKKVVLIKPDISEVHINIGHLMWEQSNWDEAIDAFVKAAALEPGNVDLHMNIGHLKFQQGNWDEAIDAFVEAVSLEPRNVDGLFNLATTLDGRVFLSPNSKVENAICAILDHGSLIRPKQLLAASQSLLKFKPQIDLLLHLFTQGVLKTKFKESLISLSEIPLLLKIMSATNLIDAQFEAAFTELRSLILRNITELSANENVLPFQSALALQCFTNEFIYSDLAGDGISLRKLETDVERLLDKGEQPSPQSILCLASFKPLVEFQWCDLLIVNKHIEEVYERQVIEPSREQSTKSTIPSLKKITDEVSSLVRQQYEKRPYPRWVDLALPGDHLTKFPGTIKHIANAFELKIFDHQIFDVVAPKILIGGCGTGQQSIEEASKYKNSKVIAVDLSLSSLAYARRKTEEFRKENIEYIHADILDLDSLVEQFDMVQSCGVLHHMNDPMAGWRVLTNRLKVGGLMKIALYSELARADIVKIREEILLNDVGSTDCAMKVFRKAVINSDKEHHQRMKDLGDFYTLSEIKDLLFHVQEHRFTIPQIQQCLSELGLKFCGFEMDKSKFEDFKLRNHNENAAYELDCWHAYEQEKPNTFIDMYQFWVQKVG